ncbi:hypothetical protein Hanom_Chr14g01284061 [Helianthus anomalus]
MANASPVWSSQRCLATAATTHGLSYDFCIECSVTCKIMTPNMLICYGMPCSNNVHLIAIRIILLWLPSCIGSSCSSTVSWRLNIFRLFHPHNIKGECCLPC